MDQLQRELDALQSGGKIVTMVRSNRVMLLIVFACFVKPRATYAL